MTSFLRSLSSKKASEKEGLLASIKVQGSAPLVELKNLSRTVASGAKILDDCCLQVKRGQIVGLIGPSGSGKSTLLRALNRLWEPAAGTVFVEGKDITEEKVITVRRRIGMLFQTPALFEGTVADNLQYGPALAGEKLTQAELEHYLHSANLDASFVDKPCLGLSGGEQQRVALARTLANKPAILLLDEPTSALDPSAVHKVEETILNLRDKQGLTVIWVSHSIDQVQRVADLAVLLVKGKIIDACPPAELLTSSHPEAQKFAAGEIDSTA